MYLTTPQRYALKRQGFDVYNVASSYNCEGHRAEATRLCKIADTLDWLADSLGPEPLTLDWPLWWSDEAEGYTMTVTPQSYARKEI